MDENSNNYQSTMDRTENNNYVSRQIKKDEQKNKIAAEKKAIEIGGPKGPEPTRYGDWEKKGRCIDF